MNCDSFTVRRSDAPSAKGVSVFLQKIETASPILQSITQRQYFMGGRVGVPTSYVPRLKAGAAQKMRSRIF